MDGSTLYPSQTTQTVSVSPLEPHDYAAWDAFVSQHPDGSPFHLTAWREAVTSSLRYDAPYLLARMGSEIVGILPLVHVKTPIFGNSLVSTGFSVGGGILAVDTNVSDALAQTAIAMGTERGVDCLELRSEQAIFDGWPTKSETYAGFRKPIADTTDDRLKAIPRKKRADVRKGIKAGLVVDTAASLDIFFDLYARNLHALGTPILPKHWYDALKTAFGDQCEIATVSAANGPVVALMSFYFRDTVYPYYVGAMPEARKVHAFDHVYWDLMDRAPERGITTFDFGRSKAGTGSYDYKSYWGFEATPLEYQYHLIRADKMPDVNPNNPKYARFVKVWQKLPFGITKIAGPLLARQLG